MRAPTSRSRALIHGKQGLVDVGDLLRGRHLGRAAIYGDDREGVVTCEPNEKLETVFGRHPPLDDDVSRAQACRTAGQPKR